MATSVAHAGASAPAGAGRRAVIVGGGVVGLSTALYLLRDGWGITVLEPEPPGETTSGGNAGLLATGHVTPVAMPGILPQVPFMLFDKEGSLTIRWPYLPKLAPWLFHFLKSSLPGRVEAISRALAGLLAGAMDAYGPLLEDAGAAHLVRRQGFLEVFRTRAVLDGDKPDLDIKRRLGIPFEILDHAAMRRLVPSLAPLYAVGVHYPEYGHVLDPKGLIQAFAGAVASRGGTFVRAKATGFEQGGGGVAAVRTADGTVPADLVVLAAGAWSKPLAAMLGARVPLDTERGYHVMIGDPGVELGCPIVSGDLRFCITPMAAGLRLAGTVEFAGLDAPPNPERHAIMVRNAGRVLSGLRVEGATYWMGFRPSMPDSMPVIGRAPGAPNAILAFGHGHIGLTAGPVTGRLVADLAAGRTPSCDPAPFRPERFM